MADISHNFSRCSVQSVEDTRRFPETRQCNLMTILQATILQATILQATILQATVLQATILQATILQATILQATVLQATVLQATVCGFAGICVSALGLLLYFYPHVSVTARLVLYSEFYRMIIQYIYSVASAHVTE
ncbi:hypothetical protein XELAEV_18014140mg [Xenopus laevis]|uniref:Uncharacterized protein n=1 Tax=Xenopus laevis TaxID=8355 RepID=A0A974HUU4_XENLA|nr:hypothetical protein XELAEV_18014140mg [Xenopus laevis]